MNRINGMLFCVLITSCLVAQNLDDSIKAYKNSLIITPSIVNCKFYQDTKWLPEAFIYNATCACLTTPNNDQANAIRYILKAQLEMVNDSIIKMAFTKKELIQGHKISKRQYRRFIKKKLTKIIYEQHVLAYKQVGCKGHAAKYWAWKIVSTRKIKNCQLLTFGINFFGPCSGKKGQW